MKRAAAGLLLALAALPARAGAQATDSTATLIGEVQGVMSGEPVVGATVFLRVAKRGAITDGNGKFRVDSIPPGTDTLAIRYPGFSVNSTVLEFEPERVVRAVFLLADKVFQVADLQVEIRAPSVDEAEVARNMRTGRGIFVTREDLLKFGYDRPSDALRNIPRVEVTPYRFGAQQVLIGSGSAACRPTYYVDGTPQVGEFELDEVQLDEIDLIEIYRSPAEIPTRYRMGTNRCGVIAIRIRVGPD
jgi:hypothetical protein